MVASIEELVALGYDDRRLAAVLGRGDWYLIGSRATGSGDMLSDWDTVLLTGQDAAGDEHLAAHLDEVFRITRPALTGPPDLEFHVRWRQAGGATVSVLGPAARRRSERAGLPEWACQLRHAVPLRLSAGIGEPYRAHVAEAFRRDCPRLARRAYQAFRASRNEAAATLARPDITAQVLTAAMCMRQAARFWLLADGEPYPSDKWLLHALSQCGNTATLLPALRAITDQREAPAARFDALWSLWRQIDTRAQDCGIEDELLAGSPFRRRPGAPASFRS